MDDNKPAHWAQSPHGVMDYLVVVNGDADAVDWLNDWFERNLGAQWDVRFRAWDGASDVPCGVYLISEFGFEQVFSVPMELDRALFAAYVAADELGMIESVQLLG